MSKPVCPMCEMDDVLKSPAKWECATCGHEWVRETESEATAGARVVKDAHGSALSDGDHEITCKMDGVTVFLKAAFVKRA
jgi:protein PhnA